MKKNEMFGWIAYAAMLALVLGIGFGVIQPMIQGANDADQIMNPILLLVLAVIASLILNAFLIEAGHLLGAAIGKYGVHSVNVLFFNFQKKKEGKGVSFSFHSYDGLTGETILYPKDVEKSKPQAVVYMPLVLFFVEVVALVVWIVLCEVGRNSGNTGLVWWEIFAIAALTVGGMLYLYDIFPAPLDSKNDGYLLTVLTNETNRVAYNKLLLGNYQMLVGEKAEEMEVYDSVTDFTYGVNDIILYRRLAEGKLLEAASIAEKAVRSQETLSGRLVHEASCQRVSLLLLAGEEEKGLLAYKEMSIEDKKHASLLGSAPAVRAHLLISGLIDGSYQETIRALDESDRAIRKSPEGKRALEENLIVDGLRMIHKAHPDWDLSAYNIGEEEASSTEEKAPLAGEAPSREEEKPSGGEEGPKE